MTGAGIPGSGLVLLGREGCGLCDEMQEALAELADSLPLPPLQVLDVDADPALARRYGLDVPVLLLDDAKVCEHHLDPAELRRLLRGGRSAPKL
jgi:thiol-disulfide isomerase/thioredoxin